MLISAIAFIFLLAVAILVARQAILHRLGMPENMTFSNRGTVLPELHRDANISEDEDASLLVKALLQRHTDVGREQEAKAKEQPKPINSPFTIEAMPTDSQLVSLF